MVPTEAPSLTHKTEMAIEEAERAFLGVIERTPDGFGLDDKSALLMAFSSIAMEHFRAIIVLCKSKAAIGSALALFRPLMDTLVRGEWLYFCANDNQRERFMKREFRLDSIGFKNMASEVDEKHAYGPRFEPFANYYGEMSDYTHSGHDAVAHRIGSDGGVEPTYAESRIRALLYQSTIAVITHYQILTSAIGDQAHFEALTDLFNGLKFNT